MINNYQTPMNRISVFRSPISCKKNKELSCKALQTSRIFLSSTLCLLGLFLFSACSSKTLVTEQTPVSKPIYWPTPPLQPRIEWVKEIKVFNRGGLNPGFWHRFSEGLFGKQDIEMMRPQAVLFDGRQRLFVVDSGTSRIHWLDMQSGEYNVLPEDGKISFQSIVGITEDNADNIYVTDSALGKIYRYNLREKQFSPFAPYAMNRPTGIVFNPENQCLYVTETGNHQVVVLDLAGQEQLRFGGRGDAKGAFNYPTNITVDSQGLVLVTDALNSRIQMFTPDGGYLCSFGKPGDSSGTFAKPKGIALDSENHIYVVDALFDAIQIFDNCEGELLLEFGKSGSKPGEFWMPSGLFIDSHDFIYVADSYNQRVQVFRYMKDEVPEKKTLRKMEKSL
jgi:DNA-binding beta-propeller fold protein YncE